MAAIETPSLAALGRSGLSSYLRLAGRERGVDIHRAGRLADLGHDGAGGLFQHLHVGAADHVLDGGGPASPPPEMNDTGVTLIRNLSAA